LRDPEMGSWLLQIRALVSQWLENSVDSDDSPRMLSDMAESYTAAVQEELASPAEFWRRDFPGLKPQLKREIERELGGPEAAGLEAAGLLFELSKGDPARGERRTAKDLGLPAEPLQFLDGFVGLLFETPREVESRFISAVQKAVRRGLRRIVFGRGSASLDSRLRWAESLDKPIGVGGVTLSTYIEDPRAHLDLEIVGVLDDLAVDIGNLPPMQRDNIRLQIKSHLRNESFDQTVRGNGGNPVNARRSLGDARKNLRKRYRAD
jgi:hypothetical protein